MGDPKAAQREPKRAQGRSKASQTGPKAAPKRDKRGPMAPQRDPKDEKVSFFCATEHVHGHVLTPCQIL